MAAVINAMYEGTNNRAEPDYSVGAIHGRAPGENPEVRKLLSAAGLVGSFADMRENCSELADFEIFTIFLGVSPHGGKPQIEPVSTPSKQYSKLCKR